MQLFKRILPYYKTETCIGFKMILFFVAKKLVLRAGYQILIMRFQLRTGFEDYPLHRHRKALAPTVQLGVPHG